MSRRSQWLRLGRLEQAVEDNRPASPTPVIRVPQGTDPQTYLDAWRKENPGHGLIVVVNIVDCRRTAA